MHAAEFKNAILPLKGSLYRYARSLLGNTEEAEDCIQDIFMRLWIKRESLESIRNTKAFALQMTRNLCLDKLRTRKKTFSVETSVIPSSINIHATLEHHDMIERVQGLMLLLTEHQRSLIHLRSIEEMEMNEIIEITGMTIEHARVSLSRARIALRQLYKKHYGE